MSPMTPTTTTTTTRPLAAAIDTVTITYRGTSYDITTRGPIDHDDPSAHYVVGCDHGYVYDPHTGHGDLSGPDDAAPMTWADAVGVATTGVVAA
jgi:hypothetical protein